MNRPFNDFRTSIQRLPGQGICGVASYHLLIECLSNKTIPVHVPDEVQIWPTVCKVRTLSMMVGHMLHQLLPAGVAIFMMKSVVAEAADRATRRRLSPEVFYRLQKVLVLVTLAVVALKPVKRALEDVLVYQLLAIIRSHPEAVNPRDFVQGQHIRRLMIGRM